MEVRAGCPTKEDRYIILTPPPLENRARSAPPGSSRPLRGPRSPRSALCDFVRVALRLRDPRRGPRLPASRPGRGALRASRPRLGAPSPAPRSGRWARRPAASAAAPRGARLGPPRASARLAAPGLGGLGSAGVACGARRGGGRERERSRPPSSAGRLEEPQHPGATAPPWRCGLGGRPARPRLSSWEDLCVCVSGEPCPHLRPAGLGCLSAADGGVGGLASRLGRARVPHDLRRPALLGSWLAVRRSG